MSSMPTGTPVVADIPDIIGDIPFLLILSKVDVPTPGVRDLPGKTIKKTKKYMTIISFKLRHYLHPGS